MHARNTAVISFVIACSSIIPRIYGCASAGTFLRDYGVTDAQLEYCMQNKEVCYDFVCEKLGWMCNLVSEDRIYSELRTAYDDMRERTNRREPSNTYYVERSNTRFLVPQQQPVQIHYQVPRARVYQQYDYDFHPRPRDTSANNGKSCMFDKQCDGDWRCDLATNSCKPGRPSSSAGAQSGAYYDHAFNDRYVGVSCMFDSQCGNLRCDVPNNKCVY